MGRRDRVRNRKAKQAWSLENEPRTINLRKFMSRNDFNCKNLRLCDFEQTGRGVATLTNLKENDVLITVPYNSMITYSTLDRMNFFELFNFNTKLTIHDMLATFLVLELHKNNSSWIDYINSLPQKAPLLPALLSDEKINLLPFDLRLATQKSRNVLEQSWLRVKKSIKCDWTCSCCSKKIGCVFNLHSYTWGFILVNTRAVYVDPKIIRRMSTNCDFLSDEPCMALCPFLDMFNHSTEAETQAELIRVGNKEWMYQLRTLSTYKKYQQVFISYGAHDNIKLLTEYGFFIPGNRYDSIYIQAEEVYKVLNLNLNDFKYKFIRRHCLNESLFFNEQGASFNLKGLLFVATCSENVKDFSAVVYTDNYSVNFVNHLLKNMCLQLLEYKLKNLELTIQHLQGENDFVLSFVYEMINLINRIQHYFIQFVQV